MRKKIVAIIGSYRKDGITDQIVNNVMQAADQNGVEAKKIHLIDRHLEYCRNCRTCTQAEAENERGRCIIDDDLNEICDEIDSADSVIFASPVNFSTVTALMKQCIERLIGYTYWPWGAAIPKSRIKKKYKKSLIITSSSCPSFLAKILMPNAPYLLKEAAKMVGSKTVKSLYFGKVCATSDQKLTDRQVKKAVSLGSWLISD